MQNRGMKTYTIKTWRRVNAREHEIWELSKESIIQAQNDAAVKRAADEMLTRLDPKIERYAVVDENDRIIWETPRNA